MRHRILRFASLIVFTLAFTALAYAQGPQRTFVSADPGVADNPSCSRTQPCRTFTAAINVVSAGGEVVALTSGGYGPVTITKSVTLTAPTGVYVAITAQFGSAITVSAASPTVSCDGDTVVLRGLTLTGLGGTTGINVTSVGKLHVEGCVISGFNFGAGINVNLSADGSHIFIKDTIVRNGFNSSAVRIGTVIGLVRASVDNCRSEGNNQGFFADNNSRVTINRSVASGTFNFGFIASSSFSGSTTELSCQECVASNNGRGFYASASGGGTATIRVSRSTATNNTFGFYQQNAGVFRSLGNNLVDGNSSGDTFGTITVIGAQ